ncbi:MAG TPA: plasma-membrane proton-efflux P-type ATPase [Polyangiaceae bacterium]|nr:plasma-membrane proton-efflux P-type ATPase [Polyangiaceae bacterium]
MFEQVKDAARAESVATARPEPVGLTADEVRRRRSQFGPNALSEVRVSVARRLLGFLWGPIPWMIEGAAVLSALARRWEELVIIVSMLLINTAVGFWEEFKADTAIAALKARLALRARVLRDGNWIEIDASELVPGDVTRVRLGNIVPADLELFGEGFLTVDQSALTGESLPVDRRAGDLVYSGSIARTGEMRGVVSAIGMETYFGKTARLVQTAQTRSHFQQAVLRIGNFLIGVTGALVALILIVALFRRAPLIETLLFALILSVAAIPVALPAVLSVTMAAGASRLAKMKAIVSRLVSIEEMAGMDILCSDKTGTLTKNELTLGQAVVIHAKDAADVVSCAALCSRASDGDAIDAAILSRAEVPQAFEVVHFEPFDPVRKRADAVVRRGGEEWKVSKGAPQAILALAGADDALSRDVSARVDGLAATGYRVLGVARDRGAGWEFLGLLPLFDPPRDDAPATIDEARGMGLSVRMVTGDHVAIARETAKKLHLGMNIAVASEIFDEHGHAAMPDAIERAEGFAQVFPEHKFAIVRELQRRGHIVGMTGDGVNDAPALKQADIGIAVSGATDAARAAADLVLTASGLSVITRAVEEARRIFERMTAYAIFRIAETIRVLLFMTLSILVFDFYPVTAVMIVLLAILNDFPIMMIAYDNAPVAPLPVRWDMHRVLSLSLLLGVLGVVASFGIFWFARDWLHLPPHMVRTVVFLKLLVAGHMTIYLTRNTGPLWQPPWPNWRLVVAAEATQVAGTLAAVYGWFVAPIGWTYALAVWGYAVAWLLVNSLAKVSVYRLVRLEHGPQARHLERIERPLSTFGK